MFIGDSAERHKIVSDYSTYDMEMYSICAFCVADLMR